METAKYAAAHLDLMLAAHNRACRAAAARQQTQALLLDAPELADRCITDRQVAVLLERAERFAVWPAQGSDPAASLGTSAEDETGALTELRALAADAGVHLPMDALARCHGFGELDRRALIVAAAPELDRAYERIYAYIADEFDRRYPTVELLGLLTEGIGDRLLQRTAFGPFGRLRRRGLLLAHGDAPSDLRQPLRLAPGVLDLLLGAPIEPQDIGGDPAETLPGPAGPVHCDPHPAERLAAGLRTGVVDAISLWSRRREVANAAVTALAGLIEVPVRRSLACAQSDPVQTEAVLRQEILTAGCLGALLWIPVDVIDDRLDVVATVLASTSRPVVITSRTPWRPVVAMATRNWIESQVVSDVVAGAVGRWSRDCPAAEPDLRKQLAARFRPGPIEAAAAGRLAATAARLGADPGGALARACATVSAPPADQLLSVAPGGRDPSALVLEPGLRARVLQIAEFAAVFPALDDQGPGDRPIRGAGGYKVLFTGEPGTGKTLAAEVIAALLGVQLVKVDLSRVISKWVGETAKHLDRLFELTADASGVLFFDEADALFGRRGEVRTGTDRYANSEVSHLLQRFEEHAGLIIVASNLRDNIDPAFTRRFQSVLHFPRPAEPERRRLWELALGGDDTDAEIAPADLDALASLDLTGAGIVGAVRAARLLASVAGAAALSMADVARGVAHQYRSEGRLFPGDVLGSHLPGPGHG